MTNTIYFNIIRDDESVSSCSSSATSEVEEFPPYHSAFDKALMALKRKISSTYGAQPASTKQIGLDEASIRQDADLSSFANLSPQSEGKIFEYFNLKSLSFVELEDATISFNPSNVLGNGSSTSPVFKGWIDQHKSSDAELGMGTDVAVKRLIKGAQSDTKWLTEIKYLGNLDHPNLVKMVGYCLKSKDRLLVSEFIPGASLEDHLCGKSNFLPLSWILRMKIASGIAEALVFLHAHSPSIIHGSIKPSNILLDMYYNIKLSDFGLIKDYQIRLSVKTFSKVLRNRYNNEYSPPEIVGLGKTKVTCAYDIYCFGKVLLELVTGKLGIGSPDGNTATELFKQTLARITLYERELVTSIIDPLLVYNEDLLDEVWAMAIMAKSCLNPNPSKRPIMRYLLRALENPLLLVREN